MERLESIPSAPRTELMHLFDRLSKKRLVYIHAPAGYGKSFSTRMWLKGQPCASTWIAINESVGRKPAEFFGRVATALASLQPENIALKEVAVHKSFATAPYEFMNRAMEAFCALACASDNEYILVLDDFHLIGNTDTLNRMPEFIAGLPESVTMFILSRAEPPDSFAEYIVKDTMAIVGVESLKFTESEIKSFFAACGMSLTMKQVGNVKEATDGWAIGLNAIMLSGEQQPIWSQSKNRSAAQPSIPGQKVLSRYLETFIKKQVWEKWDNQRRSFLLHVSIADELTPDFCDAMTGRTDSVKQLSALVNENAFISVDKENVYRIHHLFRDFLQNVLEQETNGLKDELYRKVGDWFYSRTDYYKAVEYYLKCGDKGGVTKGLKLMYNYNSPYAAIEDTLAIIRMSVDESIVDEYPFLLEVQAWAAFIEGNAEHMESYLDRYFKQLPKIILQNPASAQTSLLLRCMDYRSSMIHFMKGLKILPLKLFAQANTPSITQNMPFFHRSGRDFSEYAIDTDKSLELFRKTIGVLVGDECDVIQNLIRTGIAYERGNLNEAQELALSANVKLKDGFAPEIKFTSFIILAAILDAQDHIEDAKKILDGASAMIEHDKAYYLNANFRAFSYRLKLNNGDVDAARNWLKFHAVSPHTALTFYKLYQHFTTARAYIVTGDYNMAILFLKKLLILCEQYHRLLDVIEANILLAIAYWKKERRQNEAIPLLERAVVLSQKHNFTQMFALEGAELSNMLHRLYKCVIQKDYNGEASATHVKSLHIMALMRAKHSRGLSGGRTPKNLQFTEQQKTVIRYMRKSLTQKEIAQKMGLKPSSIKSHMSLIYKKLDVSNSMDALVKVQELGILDEQ